MDHREGPLTRRFAATSPPRERWCRGTIVPKLTSSFGGEVGLRSNPGEGAFMDTFMLDTSRPRCSRSKRGRVREETWTFEPSAAELLLQAGEGLVELGVGGLDTISNRFLAAHHRGVVTNEDALDFLEVGG